MKLIVHKTFETLNYEKKEAELFFLLLV